MIRRLIAAVLFAAALPVFGADMDMAGVLEWSIPEGEVVRVEVSGEVVWPTIPYVTNGLIAYWDGIWNAGIGIHDASAATWQDLTGNGYDATLLSDGFFSRGAGLTCAGSANANTCAARAPLVSGIQTLEIGWRRANTHIFQCLFTATTNFIVAFESGSMEFKSSQQESAVDYCIDNAGNIGTASFVYYPNIARYLNGASMPAGSRTEVWSSSLSANTCDFGGRYGNKNNRFAGEILFVRLYERALTSDEIARNAAIDAVRFGIEQ